MSTAVAGASKSKFSPDSATPSPPRGRTDNAHNLNHNPAQRVDSSPINDSEPERGRSRVRRPSGPLNSPTSKLKKKGYHTLNIPSLGKTFHVEERFKLVRELGHGAYGTVISVQDEISGEHVAIKQVPRLFEKLSLAKRALREITLLRHFANHENITGLIGKYDYDPHYGEAYEFADMDVITPDFNELYLFMEPMEADLHQIIRSGQSLTSAHIQYFIYQILRGLKYIHSAGVIHRDLKPGNLLVNSDCELKICDFGLSRGYDDMTTTDEEATHLTEYVATRWYRAPEIMLSFKRYGKPIDLWSLGCIFAELVMGKPIFKGKDYVDQLNKILDVLGSPDEDTISHIKSDRAQKYVRSLPRREQKSFKEMMPSLEPDALDLLESLLFFDPDSRPTVTQALSHKYLALFNTTADGETEPSHPHKFTRWREIEAIETVDQFRSVIWDEVVEFRKEVRGPGGGGSRKSSISIGWGEGSSYGGRTRTGTVVASSQPQVGQPSTPVRGPTEEELVQAMEGLEISRSRQTSSVSRTGNEDVFDAAFGTSGYPVHPQFQPPLPPSQQAEQQVLSAVEEDEFVDPIANTTTFPPIANSNLNAQDVSEVGGRSRKGSMRLLRSLSTISVHEVAQNTSQLYAAAPVGRYIIEKSAADAPVSELPKEFGDG